MANGDGFQMVVLGDSIQWGQGLPEWWKFSELVRQTIQRMLRRKAILVHRFAHSGAVICPQEITWDCEPCFRMDDTGEVHGLDCFRWRELPVRNFDPGTLDGELPAGVPSIHCQLIALERDTTIGPEDIDLFLIDGGINDVFNLILNPLTNDDFLRRAARCACHDRMLELLRRLTAGYPRARVVVSGYYPIFSLLSSLPLAVQWLLALGVSIGGSDLLGAALIIRLSQLSEIWAETSSLALRDAINEINTELGERRVAYAHVPFGPENCLFAPHSWLFGLTTLGVGPIAFAPEDIFIAPQRIQLCNRDGRGKEPACLWASIGHPNLIGSWQYYRAVTRALAELGVIRPRTIFDKVLDFFRRVCTWAQEREFHCIQWKEERRRECAREEDRGHNECRQWRDDGYNRCDREENQRYQTCGNWHPWLRWLCIFWVWVSHIGCVLWVWVSNLVCVVWTWVKKMVCVVWTELVYRSCQLFTYVVKKLTCW